MTSWSTLLRSATRRCSHAPAPHLTNRRPLTPLIAVSPNTTSIAVVAASAARGSGFATSAQKRAAKAASASSSSKRNLPQEPSSQHHQSQQQRGRQQQPPLPPRLSPAMEAATEKKLQGGPARFVDWVMENPALSMLVLFPSGMMALSLIIRKDFRDRLFGGDIMGGGTKKAVGDSPAALYRGQEKEGAATASARSEVEAVAQVDEGVVSTSIAIDSAAGTATRAGKNQHSIVQKEATASTKEEGGGGATTQVRDLIYAVGIRPHSSESY